MPSRKEAQHNRGGSRKARRHSSPERVNTARPDEEHCSLALRQINAEDETPASEVGFDVVDSPSLLRLKHETYNFSEGPVAAESQLSLLQRPESSGSLQRAESFTFGARQHREMNLRRERQPPLHRECLPQQPVQVSRATQKAGQWPDMSPCDGNQSSGSILQMEQSSFPKPTPVDIVPTALIDLTSGSSSAVTQFVQPSPTTDGPQPTPQTKGEERPGDDACQLDSETITKSRLESSSAGEKEALDVDAPSRSPVNVISLDTTHDVLGQKHNQIVQRSLPEAPDTQVHFEQLPQTTSPVQLDGLPIDNEPTHFSKKVAQDCSNKESKSCTASESVQEPHVHLVHTLEHPTIPGTQSTYDVEPQISSPQHGKIVGDPMEEAPRLQLPRTPLVPASRRIGKPIEASRTEFNLKPSQPHAPSFKPRIVKAPEAMIVPRQSSPRARDTAPSEEDLLYLFMYRRRQRKDFDTKVIARQKQLETANAHLSQQNQTFQRQLIAARTGGANSAAEANLQKVALNEFKTRFQKLKIFVNGLGNDYGALQQLAEQMKQSQQRLLNEKEELYRDLDDCHNASAASERSMSNIASSVAQVRQSIIPLERSELDAKKALEEKDNLLLRQQEENKRLETGFLQVTTTQKQCSSAIQDEQKVILHQLRGLTRMIDAVEKATTTEPQPLQVPGLEECNKKLIALLDADRVVPAHLTNIADAVSTLTRNLSSYQRCSDERSQAAADAQVNRLNQLISQITTLLGSSCAASEAKAQLSSLHEDNIRLREQLKASQSVTEELRESRKSADVRESHLRRTTDTLLNDREKQIAAHKPAPPASERDMFGTLQVKYMSNIQQLASSEERVRLREKEIRQREEEVKKLKDRLDQVQAERDAALQTLNEVKERHSADVGKIGKLQQELARKENSLEELRLAVESSEAKRREETERIEELSSLQEELKEVKSHLKTAIQERRKTNEEVQKLSQSLEGLTDAQQEAEKVPQLTEELRKERVFVTKLRQEIAAHEGTTKEVPGLKQELSVTQTTIVTLEGRLKEAESLAKQVETMEREASKAAVERSTLREELFNVRKAAVRATEQREEFHKTTQEVDALRREIVEFKVLADRVPILEERAQNHLNEVTRLQQELTTAQKSIEQQQDLRELNRNRNEEIASLKREANELRTLQTVRDACDEKDQEAKLLNEKLRAAEESLSRFQDLNETVSEKNKQIVTLNQEIDAAKEGLKRFESVQNANDLKDKEILSLKEGLQAAKSNLDDMELVKEESQQKENELSMLKNRIAKMEETSQQSSQTRRERPSQIYDPSQGMMAIMQEITTVDDADSQAAPAVTEPPLPDAKARLRCKAGRTVSFVNLPAVQTRRTGSIEAEPEAKQDFEVQDAGQSGQVTRLEIHRTQDTTLIPESQPAADSQCGGSRVEADIFDSMSSPLTDIGPLFESAYESGDKSAYFSHEKAVEGHTATSTGLRPNLKSTPPRPFGRSQGDPPSSRRPSSSDTMLLEADEEHRTLDQPRNSVFQDISTEIPSLLSRSTSPEGLSGSKSRATSRYGAKKQPSKTVKAKGKGRAGVSSKHPSPRKLRSESQTRLKQALPVQEHDPYDQDIPASPQGGTPREKHLPNSAAKRRLEDEDVCVPSSSQDGSKRLKRDMSALEVKTPSKRKGSSFPDQAIPATATGRLRHPSIPSGSRKGTIVGTNAPAPGAGQPTNKRSKKNSKTAQYEDRFGQDRT